MDGQRSYLTPIRITTLSKSCWLQIRALTNTNLPMIHPLLLVAPFALSNINVPNVSEAETLSAETNGLPEWLDVYGNMRVRMESTFDQSNGEDRQRGRLRFRVGAKMQVADDLKAEVRMSTASGDARNPHWDIGGDNGTDTLSGSDVVLDRINLVWKPNANATIVAGKMGNPLAKNPVFSEWILDGDIQPSGLAGVWSLNDNADVRFAHFIVDESNGAGASSDPAITVLQLNHGASATSLDWDINTSLWNWSNEGGAVDYLVWDTIVSAKKDAWTGSLEFIQNLDDDTGDDTGFALGVKHGKGGKAGQSQVFANYFDFDANASVWGVGQDDVPISPGAVGLSGVVAGYKYWWHDNTTIKVWALQGDDETDDPLRLRFDIDIKF